MKVTASLVCYHCIAYIRLQLSANCGHIHYHLPTEKGCICSHLAGEPVPNNKCHCILLGFLRKRVAELRFCIILIVNQQLRNSATLFLPFIFFLFATLSLVNLQPLRLHTAHDKYFKGRLLSNKWNILC